MTLALDIPGDIVVSGGATITGNLNMSPSSQLIGPTGFLSRSQIVVEPLVVYPVPFTDLRVFDNLTALLPSAGASNDLGIIEGTHGTDAVTAQTSDAKATTVTQKARFLYALPAEYVGGGGIKLRFMGGMITNISDDTATVDVSCFRNDDSGGLNGSPTDLVSTGETTINTLVSGGVTTVDFVLNAAGLTRGMILDFLITIAITDGATGTAVIGEATKLALLLNIKG